MSKYIVYYWDGSEWQPYCSRDTYRKAIISSNKYFGNNTLTTKIIKTTDNKMDI